MKRVLVTGANGQLGNCFRKLASNYPDLQLDFRGSSELDLGQFGLVKTILRKEAYDFCINCAAYTNVEQAEKERELAFLMNSKAVENLAEACREAETVLIHFSTDYVFDGKKRKPYHEEDEPNPLNCYASSKLSGERYITSILQEYFIFRTSWLYSDKGKNFFNTVLSKISNDERMGITDAQEGTPTNAYDLAAFVLRIMDQELKQYGLYHYSNLGSTTWYGFARKIAELSGKPSVVEIDNAYATIAKRPPYSVLSKEKALTAFQIPIKSWDESLQTLM